MIGVGHVAVITSDLDRFRAFYEGVVGLRTAVVLRMTAGPGLRHAFLQGDDGTLVHVFEQPGYDPVSQGWSQLIGERGRVDHLAFVVRDRDELEAARERLVAAGASDGSITDFGPVLSVPFTDPDGMASEVTAVVADYDPAEMPDEEIVEVPDPAWFDRLQNSLALVGPV